MENYLLALQLFPLPRSSVKRNGIERYLICWLLVALRIFPASAPPWQAAVSKRNQVFSPFSHFFLFLPFFIFPLFSPFFTFFPFSPFFTLFFPFFPPFFHPFFHSFFHPFCPLSLPFPLPFFLLFHPFPTFSPFFHLFLIFSCSLVLFFSLFFFTFFFLFFPFFFFFFLRFPSWLLVALRIFPASAPPWQAAVSKRNQVRWWCATLTLTK